MYVFSLSFTVSTQRGNPAMGKLFICFLGPSPNEHLTIKVCCLLIYIIFSLFHRLFQAINLLGTYLTSSAAAPLNKEFVEIKSPLW